MQRQGREAFLARDIERLKDMWSDDLVVNSPINRIHSKAQVLDLLQKGIIAHVSFIEHIEATMRDGDVVVVMGRDEVVNTAGAEPIHRRFTNVWRAAGDSWRLIARQATLVGPPTSPAPDIGGR